MERKNRNYRAAVERVFSRMKSFFKVSMIKTQKSYPTMLLEQVHEAYAKEDIDRLTEIEDTISSLIYNAKMQHIKEESKYVRIGIKVRMCKNKLIARKILPYVFIAYLLKTYFN